METNRKLSKIIMEYDNGDKTYIDGDNLEKWQKATELAIISDFTHGGHCQKLLKEIIWKNL